MLPCILCGTELEQRTAKNGKPYFVCDPCGTQYFVRGKQGIAKLQQLLRALKQSGATLRGHADTLFEIRAILEELDELQRELNKLDSSMGILRRGGNREKSRARKLLNRRAQRLLKDLERICG